MGLATNSLQEWFLLTAFHTREHVIDNLEEYWLYQFSVKAATVVGEMTSDNSIIFRTLPTGNLIVD